VNNHPTNLKIADVKREQLKRAATLSFLLPSVLLMGSWVDILRVFTSESDQHSEPVWFLKMLSF
jgi:hypothetical protein